ncbi:CbtA family protein [Aureimonas jatrophae]|uniref:Cobalt transporter subunit CbtA n=1 Tax=Aureimonas jatrophae TaxID=1166073 RepID=A0A1H0D7M8_9HYPH|nr:CbtA family protein [Aureimonas jatrophae]MBB3951739.1 cobalt transporter subunit CbtA [Aureimonas jatrophae]SDN65976.1 cobalt transporter subunit CbtA [Aureimonas jatrophae]
MIVRTLLVALVAGILAGAAVTPLQHLKTTPLILEAETFEGGGHDHAPHAHSALALVTPAHAHAPAGSDGEASGTAERLAGSLLANLVLGAGFALLLSAASLAANRPITRRNGALWGLAGFAVLTLAPALGLPPELPAMPAADLHARQIWWLATVLMTAGGAAILVFRRETAARLGAVALLVLPHLVGAPHPADIASPVPASLAAEFVMASLLVSAAFWALAGLFTGILAERFAGARRPAGLRAA